jgi:predicted unusual protein kinase regulating ubiquinone biosynthesis (AarF/ABC1/UbiB family)
MTRTTLQSDLRSRAIRRLQALCRHSGHLPPSCNLRQRITLESDSPISSSAMSDVYKARTSDDEVAIKVLRVHADNRTEVRKVSGDTQEA